MLVLSRKINQSIIIGDGIELCIVDIKGDQVKIGIDAPKNVSIYRKEVLEEIKAQNLKAAAAGSIDPAKLPSLGANKKNGLDLQDNGGQ
ncbi:MAG: carbon storage regulator CsrA [Spirochaetota bacterium]|jgi:carbon storage regulator|nr:carbon storage regulator CsrA [Spirochaetota bacterium]